MEDNNKRRFALRKLDETDIVNIKHMVNKMAVPYDCYVMESGSDGFIIGKGMAFARDSFRTGIYVRFDNSVKNGTEVTVEYNPRYVRGGFAVLLAVVLAIGFSLSIFGGGAPMFFALGFIPIIGWFIYGLHEVYVPLVKYKGRAYHDYTEMYEKLENILESYGIERSKNV